MLGKILVFDTETTGFRSDDEVLTLAVVDGTGKTLVDGMYAPVRKSAWPEAEKINRISPAMVADCAPIRAHQAELIRSVVRYADAAGVAVLPVALFRHVKCRKKRVAVVSGRGAWVVEVKLFPRRPIGSLKVK